jgi:hypothetical protein
MAVLLEERQKPLPDLGSLHGRWSLGVRPLWPGRRQLAEIDRQTGVRR